MLCGNVVYVTKNHTPTKPATKLAPRVCPICGANFQPYRDYQRACSRNCREKLLDKKEVARAYHARPDVQERKNAARRVTNNPGRRTVNLRANLAKYGFTIKQYEAMVAAQDNRCAICDDRPDPNGVKASSRLHVDHCHTTSNNRALLCTRCNQGLGYFRDDPRVLQAAANYIERHQH